MLGFFRRVCTIKSLEPTCRKRWKSTDAVRASRKDQKSQTRMPGDFDQTWYMRGNPKRPGYTVLVLLVLSKDRLDVSAS